MMLYTIVPDEQIWGGEGPLAEVLTYCGRPCLVQRLDDGRGCLVRLLSTDPQDFLDPRLQPGSIFEMPRGDADTV